MIKISKNKILVDLINKQRDDINDNKKLDVKSLQRISRNIENCIFSDKCVLWQGYITYISATNVHYINFFFNGKKHALHRLLYLNYIGDVNNNEYLKYSCPNKGKCCNINHIYKINSKKTLDLEKSNINETTINETTINETTINETTINETTINENTIKNLDYENNKITKNESKNNIVNNNLNIISNNEKLIIIF